jgi:2-C-methyl-D-erythritol 4-phosphate cytidylyltransferase / 2-C-methyl-D-erythritol 2,4-cyclodiphosphate synthase
MKISVIVVAGGMGVRFGGPKALVTLGGRPLLSHCLEQIQGFGPDEVLIVGRVEDKERVESIAADMGFAILFVIGGEERYESVRLGFEQSRGDVVFVQNVANPFAKVDDYTRLLAELDGADTAFVGLEVHDTLRRVSTDEHVRTFDRTDVWRAQTPQAFRREALQSLYDSRKYIGIGDEIQGTEALGFKPGVVATSLMNMKITTKEDLQFLEKIIGSQTLVGIGEDSHRYGAKTQKGRKSAKECLMLGGVLMEDLPPLEGNSDADVMLHALFNAISGALGHGSIGNVADKMVEAGQKDSSAFLTVPFEWMMKKGYKIHNVAFSLECSVPKIDPLVADMKKSLAEICKVDAERIGITATSGEGLTAFGKGEGIRCSAAVSLVRISN